MNPLLSLALGGLLALLGMVLGAATVWRLTRGEVAYLRDEATKATDRLVHAWKDGATVPPREVFEELPAPTMLPPEVLEFSQQFESAEGRAIVEERAQQLIAEGMDPAQAVRRLELEMPA